MAETNNLKINHGTNNFIWEIIRLGNVLINVKYNKESISNYFFVLRFAYKI